MNNHKTLVTGHWSSQRQAVGESWWQSSTSPVSRFKIQGNWLSIILRTTRHCAKHGAHIELPSNFLTSAASDGYFKLLGNPCHRIISIGCTNESCSNEYRVVLVVMVRRGWPGKVKHLRLWLWLTSRYTPFMTSWIEVPIPVPVARFSEETRCKVVQSKRSFTLAEFGSPSPRNSFREVQGLQVGGISRLARHLSDSVFHFGIPARAALCDVRDSSQDRPLENVKP